VKLGRRPNFTGHQQSETINRRDAGEPVHEIALLPLMEPITRDTAQSGRHMIGDAMAFLDLAFLSRRAEPPQCNGVEDWLDRGQGRIGRS
jgi:hypothetical protein